MTSQHPTRDAFADSRWSLVLRQSDSSNDVRDALSDLAQRYGYPVYAYIRSDGQTAAIAQEMTRAFLQHMIAEFSKQSVGAETPARYREYLLARLHAFLKSDKRETASSESIAASDLSESEPRYLHDYPTPIAPDHAFQRGFALQVLYRALVRVRDEAKQTGRQDMFNALEPFLARDPDADACERLAESLHTRPLVVNMALKRLRQRLRELTGQELADTVDDPAQLPTEQERLLGFLRPPMTDRPA